MTDPVALRVALTQWHATRDKAANLRAALRLIEEAGSQNADLVVLPENGLFLGSNQEMRAEAIALDGPELQTLKSAAVVAGVAVVLGGAKCKDEGGIRNKAIVIDSAGQTVGSYDKIHLFDARVGGQSFAASSVEQAGEEPAILIIKGVKVGLTICYDVRFPELYRRLAVAGAQVLLVPSAFTQTTGEAHWEVLLRARAIECGAYVIASATIRGTEGNDAFPTYGHALAVDPWGTVLEDLGEAPLACKVVSIEPEKVERAHSAIPVLKSLRPQAVAREPVLLHTRY